MPLRIIFAGGGTGGHLFPAIAIADELRKIDSSADITFIGTKYKLEAKIVPQAGYAFSSIWISGFHRRFNLRNILFPIKLIVSFIQTYFILKKIHPHVVVGTGGYVAGPVLRTAMFMKIPTVIQEQNSYPGVTTRLLAPNANEVHVTFESAVKYFTNVKNIYVTGNPTRGSLENIDKREALKYFGMDPDKNQTTLLILGGSLGALSINNAVIKHFENLINQGYRIIWQTGTESYKNILDSTKSISSKLISVKPFIEHMDYAYSAADIVISRAGATTIAELTRLGKPSILVPYPRAAADHQTENARSIADIGAAVMIVDSEISKKLEITLKKIVEDKNLNEMGAKSKNLGKPNAASDIAKRIICLAGEYGRQ